MRNKVIGLVVVLVVVGIIWFFGARARDHHDAPAPDAAPSSVLAPIAHDAGVVATADASIADARVAEVEDRGAESPACAAMRTASQRFIDEAKSKSYCLNMSIEDLSCATSKNGATWGLRLDDVTDLDPDVSSCPTGWLERVVHVTKDGDEQTMIPPGPGGVRNGHRYNVYKAAPVTIVTAFDWDADGEDEVVVNRWTSFFVWTFKRGKIISYAPAANLVVEDAKDEDGDGRPDLLVQPFPDSPSTVQLLAHSLPDGTFSLHDATAVHHAQTQCPFDAPIPIGTSEEDLANAIACARLWSHDAKTLERDACAPDAGACPPWVKRMIATKPPLSLR